MYETPPVGHATQSVCKHLQNVKQFSLFDSNVKVVSSSKKNIVTKCYTTMIIFSFAFRFVHNE